jgi:hypothetical protein
MRVEIPATFPALAFRPQLALTSSHDAVNERGGFVRSSKNVAFPESDYFKACAF